MVLKLENKIAFYFENTKEDNIMSSEDDKHYRNKRLCRFCEKEITNDKIKDHFHLTGRYRGPAHNNCNENFTQKQTKFIPFVFHNFSNYDCHLSFRKLFEPKK